MNKIDISIIVPIYNAAPYLKQCIESIINQTKKDIEIILVNDGSTDNSLDIINTYASNYTNIRPINQINMGVEKARIAGYKAAKGEYIGWVDADDMIHPKMFEVLYNLAISNNSDLAYCDYEYHPYRANSKSKWFKEYKGIKDGFFIDRNTQCWNKIFKRKLLESIEVDKLLLNYSEYCWIAAMLSAENIVYTNEKLYIYRVGHDSMSGGNFSGKIAHYLKGVNISRNLDGIIKNTPYEKELAEYFEYRYIYTLLLLMIVSALNEDHHNYSKAVNELNELEYRKNSYLVFIKNSYENATLYEEVKKQKKFQNQSSL